MRHLSVRRVFAGVTLCAAVLIGGIRGSLLADCGPFTDTPSDAFCAFVLEIFYLGITTGLTPTTFDPTSNVTRVQMAAFLSRTVDRSLQRGSRRSALDQYWTSQAATVLGVTTIGAGAAPALPKSDGLDVWVPSSFANTVTRVRTSDGRILEAWTGALSAQAALIAMGKVLVTGNVFNNPSKLFEIDPSQPAGAVTTVATNLGSGSLGLAFDGLRVWVANNGGSVSIVTPTAAPPWTVTTVSTGFNFPTGALFDGSNIWISNQGNGTLAKVDASGAVLQTVTIGGNPQFPVFDGTNIWAATGPSVTALNVIRASSGVILATLTGNGMDSPGQVAFDGQRILVPNFTGNSVSLWKAADFTPLGAFPVGSSGPYGACSDGINFWITLNGSGKLVRF
ncbi:MAG TPA: S-layer homology domain-containing protein [Thermoanaerobaculia bacterium]|nr:S-layer homology domain-containing protein [Thermoanaerobaculia bacterium]